MQSDAPEDGQNYCPKRVEYVGMLYPVGDLVTEKLRHQITHRVQHDVSCITQSNAPEDGQNYCPKHVELIWIYQ